MDPAGVVKSLQNAIAIPSREFAWTVVDAAEGTAQHKGKNQVYLSGKLAKYDPDATVEIVDEEVRKSRLLAEPNMCRAVSLFVYFPDEAIFAHRHVWNEIRPSDFRSHIAEIILGYHKHFFAECELFPVADLKQFVIKLAELNDVIDLKAKVTPPNPLFGAFWQKLKQYLDDRRLSRLTIKESAKQGSTLPTRAPDIARSLESPLKGKSSADEGRQSGVMPSNFFEPEVPIGDAAVLMAADGYGSAEVTGRRDEQVVVVKTSENAIFLKLDADITAQELAAATLREIHRLNQTRRLRHPD